MVKERAWLAAAPTTPTTACRVLSFSTLGAGRPPGATAHCGCWEGRGASDA